MTNKQLIAVLLLTAMPALLPTQARKISKSTLRDVESLLKATDLGDSRDTAMLAIEKLANSLDRGSCWISYSPRSVLEMLVELYKANKANEALEAAPESMDCGGETEMLAHMLYESWDEASFRPRSIILTNYASSELGEYATICYNASKAELKVSINSLNGTIMDRVQTFARIVGGPQYLYNYLVVQSSKEEDPDARYLKLIVDPKKQRATANNEKLSELLDKYVTSTCKVYLDAAGPVLSKIVWAKNVLFHTDSERLEKFSKMYNEVSDHINIYKACKDALAWPVLKRAAIAAMINV